MAFSAHKSRSALKERQCKPQQLREHALLLANLIREAKHFVVFTGAGISTSAGIPDFRGPQGVWTLAARGQNAALSNICDVLPSRGHMALVRLVDCGLLKTVISQNCDGLHRKSGLSTENLVELHGNTALETCRDCKAEFLRDFYVPRDDDDEEDCDSDEEIDHSTGRTCPHCGHPLYDNIIHFGEDLPAEAFKRARKEMKKADLCLVLGSSLKVTPACDLPGLVKGKLVICNLQKTPLDSSCFLRIFARIDELLELTFQHLNQEIPPWILRRKLYVMAPTSPSSNHWRVQQTEWLSPSPQTFLCGVTLIFPRTSRKRICIPNPLLSAMDAATTELLLPVTQLLKTERICFHFFGNYGEPDLELRWDDLRKKVEESSSEDIDEASKGTITLSLAYKPMPDKNKSNKSWERTNPTGGELTYPLTQQLNMSTITSPAQHHPVLHRAQRISPSEHIPDWCKSFQLPTK